MTEHVFVKIGNIFDVQNKDQYNPYSILLIRICLYCIPVYGEIKYLS